MPQGSLDNLLQRSEGWVAGLRLWLLTETDGQSSAHPRGVHGAEGLVRDYLLDEVIERQTLRCRPFCETACMERFCVELCDALRDSHDRQFCVICRIIRYF